MVELGDLKCVAIYDLVKHIRVMKVHLTFSVLTIFNKSNILILKRYNIYQPFGATKCSEQSRYPRSEKEKTKKEKETENNLSIQRYCVYRCVCKKTM
jgi:hypothetical protein